jgi:DsbC/DsbD-like thiol-disulfide interchange protein
MDLLTAILLPCLLAPGFQPAGDAALAQDRPLRARPRLVSDSQALAPGSTAHLAVTFEIDPHWHLYWPGRNDTGFHPDIDLAVPPGYTAGTPVWPGPKRLVQAGDILDHVYEDRLTVIIPVAVPADASGSVAFSASIDWLVCKKVCIPESAKVSLTLPVSAPDALRPSADKALFDAARAAAPKPLPRPGGPIDIALRPDRLVIEAPGASAIAFFPAADCAHTPRLLEQGHAKGPRLALDLEPPGRVLGVAAVYGKPGDSPAFYQIDQPLPEPQTPDERK